jgi:hypothetical protein
VCSRAPRAIALVNLGAVEWASGDVVDAYDHLRTAHAMFAVLGDVEGLAHTHEWLGFMLRESGEGTKAADHLAEAHALFTRLEHRSAAARVLDWSTVD